MSARKTKQPARPPVKHRAYMLRTCAADMTAHSGFRWPKRGYVAAPDWSATPECGHGLHGLLDGEGDPDLLSKAEDARWLVVEVDRRACVVRPQSRWTVAAIAHPSATWARVWTRTPSTASTRAAAS